MKLLVTIISWVINVFLLSLLALILTSYIHTPFKLRLFGVASQSMYPTLKKGDLIVVKEEKIYKTNDVISFTNPTGVKKSDTVTHRIAKIEDEKGHTVYRTKGDANNKADGWIVREKDILGKIKFSITSVGYVISFSRTPHGFITLVIVPAFIIVYEEVQNIKKEGGRLFSKKQDEINI